MKIPVHNATVEAIIHDVSSWEDMDQSLIISPNGETVEDGIFIMDYEGRNEVEGKTLRDALIKYGTRRAKREREDIEKYGEDESYLKLDWSAVT